MVVMMFTRIGRSYTPNVNAQKIFMTFDLLVGGAMK